MKKIFHCFRELFFHPTELVLDKPTPEQTAFATTATEILGPTLVEHGFKRHRGVIKTHSTMIIYI